MLEGSVQRSGNRLRVNVQLIDAESRAHLWAERFDKPLADLFDMQDEIVARLASQLGTQLTWQPSGKAGKKAPELGNLTTRAFARPGKAPEPTATLSFQAARISGRSRKAQPPLLCGPNSVLIENDDKIGDGASLAARIQQAGRGLNDGR